MTGTVFNADKEQGDWFSFFESEINLKTGDVEYHDPVESAGRVCIRPMAPFWESRQAQKEKKSCHCTKIKRLNSGFELEHCIASLARHLDTPYVLNTDGVFFIQ